MIQTEKEYNAIVERIEILLQNPDNIENQEAQGYIELNVLSNLVADFEENHFPVKKTNAYRNNEVENVRARFKSKKGVRIIRSEHFKSFLYLV